MSSKAAPVDAHDTSMSCSGDHPNRAPTSRAAKTSVAASASTEKCVSRALNRAVATTSRGERERKPAITMGARRIIAPLPALFERSAVTGTRCSCS